MTKKMVKLLLLLVSTFLLASCTTFWSRLQNTHTDESFLEEESIQTENISSKQKEQVIKIAMKTPSTLHPIYNMDDSVEQNLHLLFNALCQIAEDGSVVPDLLVNWEIDHVNQKTTLFLRQDVLWHDGVPLKAEDVVFTIRTIQEAKESPYKKAVENMAHVQALNDYTVQVDWLQPFSGSLQTLCFPIIPAHIYNVPYEEALILKPIGSGPYRYTAQNNLKQIVLQRNENYFKGCPKIERIEIEVIPDEESILYAFEQGLIDVIYTNVLDWGKYAKDKSATIYEVPTNYYEFIGLNFETTILQNDNLRQALAYGINREEIMTLYYLDHAILADTPISSVSYLYDETLESYIYNKEKARLLIAQEGYTLNDATKYFTKDGQTLKLSLLVNEENEDRLKVAQHIKMMYQEIGVEIVIIRASKADYLEAIESKNFEMFLGGWKLSYIPDLTFAFHSSQIENGKNYINYQDAHMDYLLRQAFLASPEDITTPYADLQQYFMKKNPYISLYFRNGALITKNKIGGQITPFPLNIYYNIEKWEVLN